MVKDVPHGTAAAPHVPQTPGGGTTTGSSFGELSPEGPPAISSPGAGNHADTVSLPSQVAHALVHPCRTWLLALASAQVKFAEHPLHNPFFSVSRTTIVPWAADTLPAS